MFRLEVERADGKTFFKGGSIPVEYRNPEDAIAEMDKLWLAFNGSGHYNSFRVIEQDGTVITELEM